MMSKRKIVMLALAACMIAILAAGGTLAYFTTEETVTNTFTIGDVEITLKESQVMAQKGSDLHGYVDADGQNVWTKEEAQTYPNLMPGAFVCKDPTVTNIGANDVYVRLKIKHNNVSALNSSFNKYNVENGNVIVTDAEGTVAANLDKFYGTINGLANEKAVLTKEYRIADNNKSTNAADYDLKDDEAMVVVLYTVKMENGDKYTAFDSFTVPAGFNNDDMAAYENLKIEVTAEAIQANGLASAGDAFAAYDLQMTNNELKDAADDTNTGN